MSFLAKVEQVIVFLLNSHYKFNTIQDTRIGMIRVAFNPVWKTLFMNIALHRVHFSDKVVTKWTQNHTKEERYKVGGGMDLNYL